MSKVKFGSLIREYRTKASMTQQELALSLGYESPQFISLLERDMSKTPLIVLGQLIILLNIPEENIAQELLKDYKAHLMAELAVGKKKASRIR